MRQTPKELHVSQITLREPDTQLEIGKRLGWLQENDGDGLESAMNRMDKMLSGVILHHKSSRSSRLTPHEKTNPQSIRKGVE